jgi:hypothetical protein
MNKLHAQKVEVDGFVFASKAEARRYSDLKMMENNGDIRDLSLQHKFPCIVNDIKVCTYIADFVYREADGRLVVEDVKGYRGGSTYAAYRIKAKLVEACFGIRIVEVRA